MSVSLSFFSQIIPILHVLMPDRIADSYIQILNHIVHLVPNFNPTQFVCDFERAEMLAVRTVFPGSRLVGCLWHYANVSLSFDHGSSLMFRLLLMYGSLV